ncbi:MAG: glucosaminidase domain-containing protein [Bacteroidetes bacterium]|nr:glucosaminidase domain-containing protein [Bacteroidota bacterium]
MNFKRTALITITFAFSKIMLAQNSTDVVAYVNTYKDYAIVEMQRTGIPASIILAQGIHETEAGKSDLVKRSNNHFGIKCKDTWTGSVVYHDDDSRGECFRSYSSPLDSYRDHSDFLKNSSRYDFLFKIAPLDYEAWARGLKKAGYATNPRYPQILIQLIKDYNLQQYSLIALGKIQPSEEILAKSASTDDQDADIKVKPVRQYPQGEFLINNTRVIFIKKGTSLLGVSEQFEIPLARLIEFNDLKEEDVLLQDQLIYLQRKRKSGDNEFHFVQPGETMYDICQVEGIRYESILSLNRLAYGEEPATGEKIYLRAVAPSKPVLQAEKNKQPIPVYQNPASAGDNTTAPGNAITHVVQTNETLYSISKKYGIDADKIQKWNKLDSPQVKSGQELIIYKN